MIRQTIARDRNKDNKEDHSTTEWSRVEQSTAELSHEKGEAGGKGR